MARVFRVLAAAGSWADSGRADDRPTEGSQEVERDPTSQLRPTPNSRRLRLRLRLRRRHWAINVDPGHRPMDGQATRKPGPLMDKHDAATFIIDILTWARRLTQIGRRHTAWLRSDPRLGPAIKSVKAATAKMTTSE